MSDNGPKYGETTPKPAYGEARPAPAYGEYATPDQQAKAAGLPLPSQIVAAPPTPGTARIAPPPSSVDGAALRNTPSQAPGTTGRRARRWDLILSLALLAYGAATVFQGFSASNDLNSYMVLFYSQAGLGAYTPVAIAQSLGMVITIASGVLYIVTFAITAQLLRRGRLAFYVPLIGAVLAGIIAAVCIFIVLGEDPTIATKLSNR